MEKNLAHALADLARRQHGLVTRSQLQRDLRCSRGQTTRLLDSRRLERVHEAVYRIGGAPVTHEQRLLAACWAGGERGSVVSHRAAAARWGFPGGDPDIVEITGPRWRRARHGGVVAHESRHLDESECTEVDGLPITKPNRTLLDLALAVERSVLDLAVEEAVRRGLASVEQLWTSWERLGGRIRPGGLRMEAVIEGWTSARARPDTRGELRLLRLVRARALPEPVAQHEVRLGDGRRAHLDLAWPDLGVALEFDPYEFHGGRFQHDAMLRRLAALDAVGFRVIQVSGADLDRGAPEALAALERHLGKRFRRAG